VAIMRDKSIEDARLRLKAVLGLAAMKDAERDVEIMIGDSTKEGLGLSSNDAADMRHSIEAFIHCAACTSFSPAQDEEVLATNIGGASNVLKFVEQMDAPLYHVSTAYVCGKRAGTISEHDLDHDAGYNNTYERSKNEAEQLVRSAFSEGRVTGAVFRPGIIVGASSTGHICQFSNFYNMLQAIEYGVGRAARNGKVVRIAGDDSCTKNLIPVDWSANQLWDAIETEGANAATHHLTNPTPPTMSFIVRWLNELFADRGVSIQMLPTLDDADGLIKRATKPFEGYLLEEPVFDRANMDRATSHGAPCPEVTAEFMTKLYRYAKSQQWRSIFDIRRRRGQSANGVSKRSHVPVADRQPKTPRYV
jgi:thioester reductase-like protein